MTGLEIGKAIFTILKGIKNVYPLVADQGTEYPFVVYRRANLSHTNTKDRFNYQELATVEIVVAANNYTESVELAKQVMYRLEHTRGLYNNISINEIKMVGAEEEFIEDAFVQKLTFEVEIL